MTIEIELASGGKKVFADEGVSAVVVWFSDPTIEKGALNGAASANYGSIIVFDSAGNRSHYAVNNPAYKPDGYEELASSNSPKDVYDAILALTDADSAAIFDEILPTNSSTTFDKNYPFRFGVNKGQTQGITINSAVAQNMGGFRVYHYLDVMPKQRFIFFGGHGFKNTFDNLYTFYLALNEFNSVTVNLEDLC